MHRPQRPLPQPQPDEGQPDPAYRARPDDRYEVQGEGDHSRRVYDTRDRRLILRAAPLEYAHAYAFVLNALNRGDHIAAVQSRFSVTAAAGPIEFFERPSTR
jgi:hypothetical protein